MIKITIYCDRCGKECNEELNIKPIEKRICLSSKFDRTFLEHFSVKSMVYDDISKQYIKKHICLDCFLDLAGLEKKK